MSGNPEDGLSPAALIEQLLHQTASTDGEGSNSTLLQPEALRKRRETMAALVAESQSMGPYPEIFVRRASRADPLAELRGATGNVHAPEISTYLPSREAPISTRRPPRSPRSRFLPSASASVSDGDAADAAAVAATGGADAGRGFSAADGLSPTHSLLYSFHASDADGTAGAAGTDGGLGSGGIGGLTYGSLADMYLQTNASSRGDVAAAAAATGGVRGGRGRGRGRERGAGPGHSGSDLGVSDPDPDRDIGYDSGADIGTGAGAGGSYAGSGSGSGPASTRGSAHATAAATRADLVTNADPYDAEDDDAYAGADSARGAGTGAGLYNHSTADAVSVQALGAGGRARGPAAAAPSAASTAAAAAAAAAPAASSESSYIVSLIGLLNALRGCVSSPALRHLFARLQVEQRSWRLLARAVCWDQTAGLELRRLREALFELVKKLSRQAEEDKIASLARSRATADEAAYAAKLLRRVHALQMHLSVRRDETVERLQLAAARRGTEAAPVQLKAVYRAAMVPVLEADVAAAGRARERALVEGRRRLAERQQRRQERDERRRRRREDAARRGAQRRASVAAAGAADAVTDSAGFSAGAGAGAGAGTGHNEDEDVSDTDSDDGDDDDDAGGADGAMVRRYLAGFTGGQDGGDAAAAVANSGGGGGGTPRGGGVGPHAAAAGGLSTSGASSSGGGGGTGFGLSALDIVGLSITASTMRRARFRARRWALHGPPGAPVPQRRADPAFTGAGAAGTGGAGAAAEAARLAPWRSLLPDGECDSEEVTEPECAVSEGPVVNAAAAYAQARRVWRLAREGVSVGEWSLAQSQAQVHGSAQQQQQQDEDASSPGSEAAGSSGSGNNHGGGAGAGARGPFNFSPVPPSSNRPSGTGIATGFGGRGGRTAGSGVSSLVGAASAAADALDVNTAAAGLYPPAVTVSARAEAAATAVASADRGATGHGSVDAGAGPGARRGGVESLSDIPWEAAEGAQRLAWDCDGFTDGDDNWVPGFMLRRGLANWAQSDLSDSLIALGLAAREAYDADEQRRLHAAHEDAARAAAAAADAAARAAAVAALGNPVRTRDAQLAAAAAATAAAAAEGRLRTAALQAAGIASAASTAGTGAGASAGAFSGAWGKLLSYKTASVDQWLAPNEWMVTALRRKLAAFLQACRLADEVVGAYLTVVLTQITAHTLAALLESKPGQLTATRALIKSGAHLVRSGLPLLSLILAVEPTVFPQNILRLSFTGIESGPHMAPARQLVRQMRVLRDVLASVDVHVLPFGFQAHVGAVKCTAIAALSPAFVLTGGQDGVLRVWNTHKQECVAQYVGHDSGITWCGFSEIDATVLSTSMDGTLRVWEAKSGKCMAVLSDHTDSILSADVSANGRYLITGSMDCTLRLWSVSSGAQHCLRVYEGHQHWVTSVKFTADGNSIVSCGLDKQIFVWPFRSVLAAPQTGANGASSSSSSSGGGGGGGGAATAAATGTPAQVTDLHKDFVSYMLPLGGAKMFTVARDQTAKMWSTVTGDIEGGLSNPSQTIVSAAAITPNKKLIALGMVDYTVTIYDSATCAPLRHLKVHCDGISHLRFSTNKTLLLGTTDGQVFTFDL